MNQIQEKFQIQNVEAKLSSLWVFLLFNMIFKDLHDLLRPGLLAEMMEGMSISESMLLVAGMLLEIPIGMIFLSRILPPKFNRWANLIAAIILLVSFLIFGPIDLDDYFFLLMQIIGLGLIMWYAWTWPKMLTELL